MKKILLLAATFLLGSTGFSSNSMEASIIAQDDSGETYFVALDSKGTARLNGNPKTFPTIKDYREGYDYVNHCYSGLRREVIKLITSLVERANGDGDSWAELLSVKSNNKGVLKILVSITDESGENKETYLFPPCTTSKVPTF